MSTSQTDIKIILQAWFLLNLRLCKSEKSEIAWTFRDEADQIVSRTTVILDIDSVGIQTTIDEAFSKGLDSSASNIEKAITCPRDARIYLTTSVLAQLFNSTDVEVITLARNGLSHHLTSP
jgi:hypothetical protein